MSCMRWLLSMILLFFSQAGFTARGQDMDDIQRNIKTVYDQTKYETELTVTFTVVAAKGAPAKDSQHPTFVDPLPPPPPPPRKDSARQGDKQKKHTPEWHLPLPTEPFLVLVYIMVSVLVILGIAIPVVLLLKLVSVQELKSGDDSLEGGATLEESEAALRMRPVLVKVDDLIKQGKLAEAIHVLLFAVVEEICLNIDTRITYSYTTREIMKKARLQGGMQDQFAFLAGNAEKVVFGRSVPDMLLMQCCINAYKSFYQLHYDNNTAIQR
jgi:hypothetical protein